MGEHKGDSAETAPAFADRERIMRMIPHRDPFLLIDSVRDIRVGESAIGQTLLTGSEHWVPGHFPGEAIMPGVLLIEALAQTAGVLVVETLGMIDQGQLVYFMSIDKARFRRRVGPGDSIDFHVRVLRGRGKVWKFWGEARVGDEIAAEAEYAAMIILRDDPRRPGAQ
ncbi:3-hydroxyacyl-ACP dehydratase FabZ [Rubrimonas cliftonensis]|uniref:3-hydroxyacyl-[acyl-carrier-protein] dehydratase FabZ n=1 Tax=Rubrimonas cliftonensis TaxID=89524 RepID=A0A1H4BF81_9RHOB|nr:3-hydroxyacyl-ACP dehydratase FabZ [Rubrimonas cliftonensis]SEA46714.1 3-hydroxyacyl-[acyl-carrier-protein] dehydratase [Rubrimonas cliftonensis]